MNESDSTDNFNLASFYDIAQNFDGIDEEVISPSLHEVSQITNRYQSPEFLASGGMKRVVKVYDARCKRHVAMATLHEEAPVELFDPLIHEAWLTSQLDHPNIITVHDVGVDENQRPYFTMDLKTGDSLAQLINKLSTGSPEICRRYPLTSLLQMFVKICDAVAYAHSVSVLHLDLKPANIQVGEYGEVLVCDWGMGRVIRRDDGIEFERLLLNSDLLSSGTLFGQVRGTPGYMAPEQIESKGERDVRTDIYQLGCVLYSLLTLQRPVEGTPEIALEKAAVGAIVRPRKRAPDRNIPASLEAVALKAMSVDPNQRYQSAVALGDEVERYLTGFATEAERAGVMTQISLLYKRNRRFCLTVIFSTLAMIYGATYAYWRLADSKARAETNLMLYEAGLGRQDMLSARNADSVERVVVELHLNAEIQRPQMMLQAALQSDPGNPAYLRALGEHYFIIQKFNEALTFLTQGEKRNDEDRLIEELAREFALIKPEDDVPLTTEQMLTLLRRIENFNGIEAMLLVNDIHNRFAPDERAAIIEEHLRSINPDWTNGWFEYDFAENSLKLGGKGLKQLSYSGRILEILKPRILDLSGSEVTELWKETTYAIETLDIRGCPLKDFHVLLRMFHLTRLVIEPGQFSSDQLAELPPWVEVVEKSL